MRVWLSEAQRERIYKFRIRHGKLRPTKMNAPLQPMRHIPTIRCKSKYYKGSTIEKRTKYHNLILGKLLDDWHVPLN